MKTLYLHYNHHRPAEDKANGEMDSPFYNLDKDKCDNLIDPVYEVEVDIDEDTGHVHEVRFHSGQVMR